MKILVASHVIHLDENQRKKLNEEAIELTGVCYEVWITEKSKTDEPSIEMFSRYIIKRTLEEVSSISDKDDFYLISLSRKDYHKILPIREEGCEHLNFSTKCKVFTDDNYDCLHQVVISTKELLDRSLYFNHLSQMGCK